MRNDAKVFKFCRSKCHKNVSDFLPAGEGDFVFAIFADMLSRLVQDEEKSTQGLSFLSLSLSPPPHPPKIKFMMMRENVRNANSQQLKWTKAFRKSAGKEMIVDSTLTFAARRNVPVRYNRDLVATTLKAMERVSAIRAKRERVFYKNRMVGNKAREKAADRKLVAENEHLLPRVRASEKMDQVVEEPLEEEVTMELPAPRRRQKHKVKQRLLVTGGVEDEMNVD